MSSVRNRPFLTSRAIACRETPRILAASACEIHSSAAALVFIKWVDNVNLFVLSFLIATSYYRCYVYSAIAKDKAMLA